MNCVRAIAILDSMAKGQLTATPKELDELVKHELVVELDPWILTALGGVRQLWQTYAGQAASIPNGFWNPSWLQMALRALEEKLRSDLHRAITSNAKLDLEEHERIAMRRGLGLLTDPEASAQAQQTAHILDNVLAPNTRLVACPPDPSPVYGVTRLAGMLLVQGQVRQAKLAAVEVGEFVKTLRKAEAKMQQLTQQVEAIDQELGFVRKGRHQVVAGLIKSGLPAQQAVPAYQQAEQRARRIGGHPAEPPHLAVTMVRHAMDTRDVGVAEQRMRAAEAALLRRGVPSGPVTRGAAKSLLGFPDLEVAAARFVELCGWLNQLVAGDPGVVRYAARLMPVKSDPRELALRCQAAAQMLHRAGYGNGGRVDPTAVALAAMSTNPNALGGVVSRFIEILRLVSQGQVGSRTSNINGALELTACPGTPQEVVATARDLSLRLSAGGRSSNEAFELACSLAKRVAF